MLYSEENQIKTSIGTFYISKNKPNGITVLFMNTAYYLKSESDIYKLVSEKIECFENAEIKRLKLLATELGYIMEVKDGSIVFCANMNNECRIEFMFNGSRLRIDGTLPTSDIVSISNAVQYYIENKEKGND